MKKAFPWGTIRSPRDLLTTTAHAPEDGLKLEDRQIRTDSSDCVSAGPFEIYIDKERPKPADGQLTFNRGIRMGQVLAFEHRVKERLKGVPDPAIRIRQDKHTYSDADIAAILEGGTIKNKRLWLTGAYAKGEITKKQAEKFGKEHA